MPRLTGEAGLLFQASDNDLPPSHLLEICSDFICRVAAAENVGVRNVVDSDAAAYWIEQEYEHDVFHFNSPSAW